MCCLPHSKARFYYSTHKLNYSRTQLFTNLITHELTNSQTYILTNLITHELTNLHTHELTNSITHKLTNLKSYNIFYKTHVASHSLLAKKKPKNKQIGVIFSLTCFFFCPFFLHITCILHHFAFLFWLSTRIFQPPITHFLSLKSYFLTTILPFLGMCFMVLKRFVYTIAVDVYAFHPAFSTILHCVLHHFTLHLAPKRTAFSSILHCI